MIRITGTTGRRYEFPNFAARSRHRTFVTRLSHGFSDATRWLNSFKRQSGTLSPLRRSGAIAAVDQFRPPFALTTWPLI